MSEVDLEDIPVCGPAVKGSLGAGDWRMRRRPETPRPCSCSGTTGDLSSQVSQHISSHTNSNNAMYRRVVTVYFDSQIACSRRLHACILLSFENAAISGRCFQLQTEVGISETSGKKPGRAYLVMEGIYCNISTVYGI